MLNTLLALDIVIVGAIASAFANYLVLKSRPIERNHHPMFVTPQQKALAQRVIAYASIVMGVLTQALAGSTSRWLPRPSSGCSASSSTPTPRSPFRPSRHGHHRHAAGRSRGPGGPCGRPCGRQRCTGPRRRYVPPDAAVKALSWLRAQMSDPKAQFAIGAGLMALGLDLLTRNIGERLDHLEARGWTPVDNMATVADLEQLRGELVTVPDEETPPEEAGP